MNRIILYFLFIALGGSVQAQSPAPNSVRNQVESFIRNSLKKSVLKDTTNIYTFAFKLVVAKGADSKAKVITVDVNDTLATLVFPEYLKLKKLDFSALLNNKDSVEVVIPIIMWVDGTKLSKLKKNDFLDVNKMMALFFNKKDSSSNSLGGNIMPDTQNQTLLFPFLIGIDLKYYD